MYDKLRDLAAYFLPWFQYFVVYLAFYLLAYTVGHLLDHHAPSTSSVSAAAPRSSPPRPSGSRSSD